MDSWDVVRGPRIKDADHIAEHYYISVSADDACRDGRRSTFVVHEDRLYIRDEGMQPLPGRAVYRLFAKDYSDLILFGALHKLVQEPAHSATRTG